MPRRVDVKDINPGCRTRRHTDERAGVPTLQLVERGRVSSRIAEAMRAGGRLVPPARKSGQPEPER
jgi:hypothetical protein